MIRVIRSPDIMWYVEYWDDEYCLDFPVGTAYIWEYQDGEEHKAEMCFLLVSDEERRRGIATKLLTECEKRWPGIKMTEPTTRAGKALRASRKRLREFDNGQQNSNLQTKK